MAGIIRTIRDIKIICKPCPTCVELKKRLDKAVATIERENEVKLTYKYHHDSSFKGVDKLSVSMATAPIVVINGRTEFAGGRNIPTEKLLKDKLTEIMRFGHMY